MLRPTLAVAVILLLPPVALAQTGPQLLLKPWAKEELIETESAATFLRSGHTRGSDFDARLSMVESSGRVRIVPGNLVSPRIGYDFSLINVESNHPGLPRNLWDQSIAFGTAIGQYEGWVAGVTVGVGYSGDRPFGNDNGWYGRATLGVGKELGEDSLLGIAIDYDGNRSLYPDIPLIGVEYAFRLDPTIRMVVGAPLNSITWTPTEEFELELTYTIPDNFGVTSSWQFIPHLWLYGNYTMFSRTYHVDRLPGNDRLFFDQKRVEVGLRYQPIQSLSMYAGVGYAFGQKFSSGWNANRADGIAKLSDEPYGRFGLTFHY